MQTTTLPAQYFRAISSLKEAVADDRYEDAEQALLDAFAAARDHGDLAAARATLEARLDLLLARAARDIEAATKRGPFGLAAAIRRWLVLAFRAGQEIERVGGTVHSNLERDSLPCNGADRAIRRPT